ncbi:vitamin B6 photo-protection and homoeostasis-domain-containing protein [Dendryphion nanum]|uniref:Vitamin B6 photo-protection and homoeostasis-domain-containing protein n=1 Tax=Dendryphion nanum TaxID=256645 RepID=A0A9P9DTX1_9PLEO|nr:vitamin B6 photo-protection and homoeostasis-domain-containing protein [Dendryphion nanum]
MASTRLEIIDYDDAGNVTASYIESNAGGKTRVDVILPKESKSYIQQILDVFLPAGYPQSVTDDYIQYQIYDSLQAFSSSIAGLLSSRAVLEGVGVGDANASPTAALLLNVLQESMGRIATILFAHKLGTSLEPECKMYRLAADIFNDTAMVLDCLSPAFPKTARVLVLSFSSVLRALCGVCAGSSKASLSAHFAKRNNLGELNAKDSSQETVISLLGMLAGSIIVSHISSPLATWSTLLFLLSLHLGTNYAAVSAVSLRTLNRQRASIVFATAIQTGRVLGPAEVARVEKVFEWDGVLRWAVVGSGIGGLNVRPDSSDVSDVSRHVSQSVIPVSATQMLGSARLGVPFETLLGRVSGVQRHERTGARRAMQGTKLSELLRLFQHDGFVLWWDRERGEAVVVLKKGCGTLDVLKAWMVALVVARRSWERGRGRGGVGVGGGCEGEDDGIKELGDAKDEVENLFGGIVDKLRDRGWDLDIGMLETRAATRVLIEGEGGGGGGGGRNRKEKDARE